MGRDRLRVADRPADARDLALRRGAERIHDVEARQAAELVECFLERDDLLRHRDAVRDLAVVELPGPADAMVDLGDPGLALDLLAIPVVDGLELHRSPVALVAVCLVAQPPGQVLVLMVVGAEIGVADEMPGAEVFDERDNRPVDDLPAHGLVESSLFSSDHSQFGRSKFSSAGIRRDSVGGCWPGQKNHLLRPAQRMFVFDGDALGVAPGHSSTTRNIGVRYARPVINILGTLHERFTRVPPTRNWISYLPALILYSRIGESGSSGMMTANDGLVLGGSGQRLGRQRRPRSRSPGRAS